MDNENKDNDDVYLIIRINSLWRDKQMNCLGNGKINNYI